MGSDYEGVRLTAGIAEQYALEMLRGKRLPSKKEDITSYALAKHREMKGLEPKQGAEIVMKKALRALIDEGLITRVATGFYKSVLELNTMPPEDESAIELETTEFVVEAEKVLGEGSGSLYVYYNRNDRRTAEELDGLATWPCKIGMTRGDVAGRIEAQGIRTSMGSYPIIGLIIKTDNPKSLEGVLHTCLRDADAWIDDAPGSEWFKTSPAIVEEWYYAYGRMVDLLSQKNGVTI